MITLLARTICSLLLVTIFAGERSIFAIGPSVVDRIAIDPSDDFADDSFADEDITCEPPVVISDRVQRRVFRVTAYCDRGVTAAGVDSGTGQCAAPADVPFGSRIFVPELGRSFVVTDRTARRFRHNTVDIFMPSRNACRRFGRNYLECEVLLPDTPHTYGSPSILENNGRGAVASR